MGTLLLVIGSGIFALALAYPLYVLLMRAWSFMCWLLVVSLLLVLPGCLMPYHTGFVQGYTNGLLGVPVPYRQMMSCTSQTFYTTTYTTCY